MEVVLKKSGEKQIIEHLEILLHLDEFNAIFSSSFRLDIHTLPHEIIVE